MKNKLSQREAAFLLEDGDEEGDGDWQQQIIVERRQAKIIKKDLSTRPEKKWTPVKKNSQFRD